MRLCQSVNKVFRKNSITNLNELGSVSGPVIQANGRLSFEDDLRSVGLLYRVSQ